MAAAKIKIEEPEDKSKKTDPSQQDAPAEQEKVVEDAAGASDAGESPETAAAEQPEVDEDAVAAEADAIVNEAAQAAQDLADELAKAKKEAAEARDRYVRLQAEWDNYRKRTASERDAEKQRATESLVKELLPVIDDFERAIEHAKANPDVDTLIAGVEAVHTKFLDVLGKFHVVQISPEGEAFDVNCHQAVGTKEDTEVYDETVVQVYQCGYEMGGHIVRPAMVVVSTGGPKRPPEETEDASED